MPTTSYDIRINSAQAERALSSLQGSLGRLNGAFSGLQSAIAGLALGSFITQAYKMADAILDVADATGISVANIKGFQAAIKGSVDGVDAAGAGLGKFAMAIEAAASGSKEMQDRFLKLGISLNDLRTLSEQDLLGRVVQSLGQLGPGSERAALGIGLFGKSFRSANWGQIATDIDSATKNSVSSAAALKAAGDASDSLANAVGKLQVALLVVLKPLSDFIVDISENEKVMRGLVQTIVTLTAAFVGLTVVGRIAAFLALFKPIVLGIASAFTVATASLTGFTLVMSRLFGWLGLVVSGLTLLDQGIKAMTGTSLVDWVKEAVGLSEDLGNVTTDNASALNEQAEAAKNTTREVTDAMAKQKEAIRAIATAYQDSTAAANEKYAADTALVGASERQKLLAQEINTAYDQYRQQFSKLTAEYDKLRVGTESERKAAMELYPEFEKLTVAYQTQKSAVRELTTARAAANEQYQLELFNTKARIDAENQLMDIQHEMATSTMSAIEKKYADIDYAAQKSAKSAIEAEEARRGVKLDPNEARQYYEAAAQGLDRVKNAAAAQYDQSRRFSTGWEKAFREYADNATNAAQQAERMFAKFTQGMEDLIVNFVKTGKFEWKDFVASMLEELLRSQIRTIFASLLGGFTGGGGGGGLLGGMGGGNDLLGGLLGGAGLGGQTGGMGGMLGGMGGGFGGGAIGTSPNNPVYVYDIGGGGGMGGMGGMGGLGGVGGLLGGLGGGLTSMWDSVTNQINKNFVGTPGDPYGYAKGADPLGDLLDAMGLGQGSLPYETTKAEPDWYSKTQAENFYEPWKNSMDWLGENANKPYEVTLAEPDWFSKTQADNFYEPWKNNQSTSWWDDLTSGWGSNSFEPALDFGTSSIPTYSYGSGEDLFSGIGDWFDGWFANGGNIGPGKWGIVGEAGPEWVQGPATVTPMTGMGQNVTYNINAVDAASFKALIAQDPSFIHAVAMQGAKGIPGRR